MASPSAASSAKRRGRGVLGQRRQRSLYVGDGVRYAGGLVGYNDGAVSHDSSAAIVSAPTASMPAASWATTPRPGRSAVPSPAAPRQRRRRRRGRRVAATTAGRSPTPTPTSGLVSAGLCRRPGRLQRRRVAIRLELRPGERQSAHRRRDRRAAGGALTEDYWDEGTSGQTARDRPRRLDRPHRHRGHDRAGPPRPGDLRRLQLHHRWTIIPAPRGPTCATPPRRRRRMAAWRGKAARLSPNAQWPPGALGGPYAALVTALVVL